MVVKVIKKSYSDSDISAISKDDMEILKMLSESYSEDELLNVLNEYYASADYGYNFNRTGGASAKGVSGFIKSIPSFAISAFLCWPATLIAGLGVMSMRFQKRWEDKKSWLDKLKPQYWADYMANPHELGLGPGKGGSLADKVIGLPVVAAGAALGSKRAKRTKDGMKQWWEDEKKGAKKTLGIEDSSMLDTGDIYLDSSTTGTFNGEDLLTPEQVKNIVFREFWIKLTNDEIIRLRADSEEHIKELMDKIIDFTKNTYDKLNARIESNYPRFTFYFDDGEVAYWSAQDEKTAKKEVINNRLQLVRAMNMTNDSLMKLQDLSVPTIKKQIRKKKSKIELPEKEKYKIQTYPFETYQTLGKNVPKMIYKTESTNQYNAQHSLFNFSFPSGGYTDGKSIAIDLINTDIAQKISRNAMKNIDVYAVIMGDYDKYNIPANNESEATELAKEFAKKKTEIILKHLSYEGKDLYENIMEEYGESILSPKSITRRDSSYDVRAALARNGKIRRVEGENNYGQVENFAA